MPASAATLLRSANLAWGGSTRWFNPVPLDRPGVYMVSLTGEPEECPTQSTCPISSSAIQRLLERRPELLLDGHRPTLPQLAERISSLWLVDEGVLYIGLAGTSVARRVAQYYRTALGAERPHAGGWPLKTLANMDQLWVHYASCADPADAERTLLHAFSLQTSPSSRARLHDPDLAIPFANLMLPGGRRKRHGITGARGGIDTTLSVPDDQAQGLKNRAASSLAVASTTVGATLVTQRVTEVDLRKGVVRIPAAAKSVFPSTKQIVYVILRGKQVEASWDPRSGPDRSRSGVIRIGSSRLAALVSPDERLTITAPDDGTIVLE